MLGRLAVAGVAELLGCERSFPHCTPRVGSTPTEADWALAERVASKLAAPAAEAEARRLDAVGHIVLLDYLEHVSSLAVGEATSASEKDLKEDGPLRSARVA